jgi:predicted nucleic acid-binding protein
VSETVFVIDACVAVKWVKTGGEEDVDAAARLLGQHRAGDVTLAAPDYIRLEIQNALWASKAPTDRLVQTVQDIEDVGLRLYPVDLELLTAACSIAAEHDLTIYDAIYAALAKTLGVELITCDASIVESGACDAHFLGEGRTSLD